MMRTALTLTLAAAALAAGPARAADDASGRDGYAIETAGSTTALKVGEKGKLVLAIRPRAPWHVDPRAPLTVQVEAPPALAVERTRATRKDAVDPQAEVPRFELPFQAGAAGATEARAKLKFFLCKDTICAQQTAAVAFPVAVK